MNKISTIRRSHETNVDFIKSIDKIKTLNKSTGHGTNVVSDITIILIENCTATSIREVNVGE